MEMNSLQNERGAGSEATAQADSWQWAEALFGAARCGWNFEGSNWENPNALDYKYWACIRAAIEERWWVLFRDRTNEAPGLDAISPHRFVVNNAVCRRIGTCLNTMAEFFADPAGRENWQDFPNTLGRIRPTYFFDGTFWTQKTQARTDYLYNRNGCHYNELPQAGSPASSYAGFLKAARNALNLMTVYAPDYVPAERCYAGIDYNPYMSGSVSQETEHTQNRETMERYLRVVKTGTPETYRKHTYFTDTFLEHVTSGAELSRTVHENPGTMTVYTASIWRGEYDGVQRYDEYTANPRLRFDFGLSLSPHYYSMENRYAKIPGTHDWDGDDYDITVSRATRDYSFTPLFYPHRATDGAVILLLHTGTDLRRLGGVTLDSPVTYESTIPAGFHTFDVGKLSESPTFTLGDEAGTTGGECVLPHG